jgi:diguanylate cyclase (GGDEF)-like protein/PAS domain S-box-containing protein
MNGPAAPGPPDELLAWRALVEEALDGVVVIGPDGRIRAATPPAARLVGAPVGDLVGSAALDWVHPDDRDRAAEALVDVLTDVDRGRPDLVVRLLRREGGSVEVELATRPGMPHSELVDGIVVVVRDVTHRSQAEFELRTARALQMTVEHIATRFVDAGYGEIDTALHEALHLLGSVARADRAFVVRYDPDLSTGSITHEWCGHGVEPVAHRARDVPNAPYATWMARLAEGEALVIEDVSEIAAAEPAFASLLGSLKMAALLALPVIGHGRLLGVVALSRTEPRGPWAGDVVRLVRIAAGLVGSLLARQESEQAAHAAEERYRALVEHASDLMLICDPAGRITHAAGRRLLAFTEGEPRSDRIADFVHPDDLDRVVAAYEELVARPATSVRLEVRVRSGDGNWLILEVVATNHLDHPSIGGIVINARDITDRRRAETELRENEERLRTLVASLPGSVYRCRAAPPWDDVWVSDGVETLTGWPAEAFMAREVRYDELILPEHRPRTDEEMLAAIAAGTDFTIEYPLRTRWGEVRWMQERGRAVYDPDGTPTFVDGVIFDITERKELEQRLAWDAAHDPLTGLVNRTQLLEALHAELARAGRSATTVAVLYLDLDRFKLVNDTFGHAAGDELLVEVARRLQSAVRTDDLVARSGGDEFVVVCAGVRTQAEVQQVTERLHRLWAEPFTVRHQPVYLSVSIGVAIADPLSTPGGLLRDADIALYRAKEEGRGRTVVFDETLRERVAAVLAVESDLHRGLAAGELVLHYQPIVELPRGRPVGIEGLLRWRHPTRGLLTPDAFLEAAESSGLIVEIGRRVLAEACRTAGAGGPLGDRDLFVSVNLSPPELLRPDLLGELRRLLAEHRVPAGRLCLEITEHALVDQGETTRELLARVRDLGVRVAIDDFGTGYSSLSYLRHLPVDVVKIDRTFVTDVHETDTSATIVGGVARLAAGLGLEVVAEGVEEEAQAAALAAVGVRWAQGWLFARPGPLADILAGLTAPEAVGGGARH